MTYYKALRTARLYCGYSQSEVAAKLGVSRNQICKWEKGEGSAPNLSRLIQLANVYNISIDQLVGRT